MSMSMSGAGAAVERAARLVDAAPDTPEVVVDLEVVRRNIESAARLAAARGVALRPHTKTHKLPRIAQMQVDAGAAGIMVAKLGEAESMVDGGLDEVLVGFPLVGDPKLRRLEALLDRARISVAVDSVEVAEGIARLGRDVPVLLELDTGLRRLGYEPGEAAVQAGRRIQQLEGITLRGVLTHEGHVYRRARNAADSERLAGEAARACAGVADELGLEVVSLGASGTLRFTVACPGVTEVRPGTYVFNDLSLLAIGACTLDEVAAVVVATVVARPEPTRAVIDAGSKTLTSDRLGIPDAPATFGRLWDGDDTVVRVSEEHGVLEIPASSPLRVGDRVAVVPNHICPVVNLADAVTVVEGDDSERWPVVARGKVQ
jgi:D-serine deaminase-like pyridoxal phosphate-dependent protein